MRRVHQKPAAMIALLAVCLQLVMLALGSHVCAEGLSSVADRGCIAECCDLTASPNFPGMHQFDAQRPAPIRPAGTPCCVQIGQQLFVQPNVQSAQHHSLRGTALFESSSVSNRIAGLDSVRRMRQRTVEPRIPAALSIVSSTIFLI